MRRTLLYVTGSVLLSGLLQACGGGSSGGGEAPDNTVTFTGLTSQAQVTETNAPELATAALTNGTASATSSTAIGVAGKGGNGSLPTHHLSNVFGQIDIQRAISPAAATSVAADPVTQDCADGGRITGEATVDPNNGSFSGDITFENCAEAGLTSNGTMTFSGSVDIDSQELNSSLTLAFTDFNTRSTGNNTAAVDITLNGSMECDLTAVLTAFGCTQSFDVRDNLTGETFRTENLQVAFSDNTGGSAVSISGNFYHPDHGYVEIVTDTALSWADGDSWPSSGEIRLLGTANSSARITVIDNTQYMLEVDNDGDGVFESNSVEDWPV